MGAPGSGPTGRIVARVSGGTLFEEIEREPGWVHVRRSGWMFGPSLEALDGGVVEPNDPEPTAEPALPVVDGSVLDYAVTAGAPELRVVPDGDVAGTLVADRPVRIVARSGEWVRVQTYG